MENQLLKLFHRVVDDYFNDVGVLRLDVGSHHEEVGVLKGIFLLITKSAYELFECDAINTKTPIYSVERTTALQLCYFEKTDNLLGGGNNYYEYDGYWSCKRYIK